GVAVFDHNVFPFYVPDVPKPLAKCLDKPSRVFGIAAHGHISDPRDFLRLLRLSERAKRQEHSAKRKPKESFCHEFPPVLPFALCALCSFTESPCPPALEPTVES